MTSLQPPDLSRRIARLGGRRHAVLVGSGTAALYCAFEVLRRHHPRLAEPAVLFPNVTCETAVHAAVFAGCTPRFCDVSAEDALLDAAAARRALTTDASVICVVPTQIYGHLGDVNAYEPELGAAVPLIEDAAQAYGGEIEGCKAGAMGLASVVSFGTGKLLDCGGGGAVLCDDDQFATACREVAASLPADDVAAPGEREQVMRKMLGARRALRADRAALVERQLGILQEHRNGYLWQCAPRHAVAIDAALPGLESIVSARTELTRRLDESLDAIPGIRIPQRAGSPALWRYTFYVAADRRDVYVERLQRAGLTVSKLFAPCTDKFSPAAEQFPVSARLAAEVVNICFPARLEDYPLVLDSLQRAFEQ